MLHKTIMKLFFFQSLIEVLFKMCVIRIFFIKFLSFMKHEEYDKKQYTSTKNNIPFVELVI